MRERRRIWLLAMSFCLAPGPASAAPEPEWWDHLPQIGAVVFSETSLGLVAGDGRRFVLDRATLRLDALDAESFASSWPETLPVATPDRSLGPRAVVLHATGGRDFVSHAASCSEGDDEHHALHDGWVAVAVPSVDPCESISAAEIVGDQLWLGTRRDGEGSAGPGRGVVIQPLSGTGSSRSLTRAEGLSGDLIRAIRRDPYRNTTWVVSERGLSEIDADLRVVVTRYFYEDFDAASGRSVVKLDGRSHASDPLAILARQLGVADTQAYHAAVLGIPPAMRAKLRIVEPFGAFGHFVPEEMNVLVPFLITATGSSDSAAAANAILTLCRFKDARIPELLRSIEADDTSRRWAAKSCLDGYARGGLRRSERPLGARGLPARAGARRAREAPGHSGAGARALA